MTRIGLKLKEKYSLVHVPYDRKVRRWLEITRSHIRTGQSPENAGVLAARLVFPYECREHNIHGAATVEEILAMDDSG